jgi:hypothetical protein
MKRSEEEDPVRHLGLDADYPDDSRSIEHFTAIIQKDIT